MNASGATVIARQRVEALLSAARRLRDPEDELGRIAHAELPAITGLSAENVALALAEHLEEAPSEALFEGFARPDAARAAAVHVVLSANVFVASLRALCLAAIRGDRVVALPSRREPLFTELLVRALTKESWLTIGASLAPAAGDEVHAYGSDETLAAIAAKLPTGCGYWRHGAGLGVVACTKGSDVDVDALADDVVIFDQRGCLSPKLVVVRSHGAELARGLAETLAKRLRTVPLGTFDEAERLAARTYRDTLSAAGEIFGEPGALVGLVRDDVRLFVSAAPRTVHVVESPSLSATVAFLEAHARVFTCLAGDDEDAAAALPLARRARLGLMQRPPLDGPVDRREPPPPLLVETTAHLAR